MVTDLVANNLTMVRNALRAKKEQVDVPASKLFLQILDVFKREGFIRNYKFIEDKKQGLARVYLKYSKGRGSVITAIKKISKPGLRIYKKCKELPYVLGGMGFAIVSTSQGILTDKECRKRNLGGEVICYIW